MRLAGSVSAAQAKRLLIANSPAAKGGNKFGAQKVVNTDGRFDSGHEAAWAGKLILLRDTGVIKNLKLDKRQLKFSFDIGGVRVGDYTADARFDAVQEFVIPTLNGPKLLTPGEHYVCDAKSPPTRKKADYRLRANLMLAVHQIEILEL